MRVLPGEEKAGLKVIIGESGEANKERILKQSSVEGTSAVSRDKSTYRC